MKTVTVPVAKLLETLKTNRVQHEKDYADAKKGYIDTAREKLQELLAKLDAGEIIQPYLQLTVPESHLEDYDRSIMMLEWHVSTNIEVTVDEFAKYVQDNWDWKERWSASNSYYMAKTRGLAD